MKKYILAVLLLSIGVSHAQEDGAGKYAINYTSVNTKNSDWGATFYGDNQVVYSSPKKGFSIVNDVWLENNQRYLELYIADIKEDGDLSSAKLLKGDVNTRFHEAQVIFTKDKNTVYFTRSNYYNKTIARGSDGYNNTALFKASVNEKGEWVNIIPMPFNNVEYGVGHPALSPDERTLYFVSDMPGGYGETDIYKVSVNESGFGNPVNLGAKINSEAKEFTPYIDGEVLYFSSNKAGGNGGFDVYATRLVDFTPEPVQLNEPVNSSGDDIAFIMNSQSRKGYFSSNRAGGQGDDDIYSFVEEEPIVFKCQQIIAGEVRDQQTTEIIAGATVTIKDDKGEIVSEVEVNEEGEFELPVYCDTPYQLVGSKTGYTSQSKSLTTSMEADKRTKLLILLGTGEITELEPVAAVEEDKPEGMPEVLPEEIVKVRPSTYVVNIEPIYFELNSSYLNKEAKRELDKVIELMEKYPEMIIESGSHTDSRGIEGYNVWLSTRRAASTVNYIIEKGVDPSRITGKGYGETQLINECSDGAPCTEAQHAMNRRTEFVIIKM